MKDKLKDSLRDKLIPFKNLIFAIDMIVETFGEGCEGIVYDFENFDQPPIYIKGNLIERELRTSIMNLILKNLHKDNNNIKDKMNIITCKNTGRILKTSIIFIRDKEKNVIGCFEINFDITKLIKANDVIQSMCKTRGIEIIKNSFTKERYPKNIEQMFVDIVQDTIKDFDMSINEMKKDDRLKFVNLLVEKGTFSIQGSPERVSEILNVSRQSIYNYLGEIRSQKEALSQ
ncbi:PAS domain-containing protein [Priestia megaterium]|uniref:PAS domain-containing protein n=1 Tax=Priestia megaterium TaxID=1404 RepID=UPI00366DB34D